MPCPQTVEKRRERTRELRAVRIPIVAGGAYGDYGRGFFLEKTAALQILRPESAEFQQNLERLTVAGELASTSTSLSKRLFDKLKPTVRRVVSDGRKTQGEHEIVSGHSNSNCGRRRVRRPRALIFSLEKSLHCRFCGRNPQDSPEGRFFGGIV